MHIPVQETIDIAIQLAFPKLLIPWKIFFRKLCTKASYLYLMINFTIKKKEMLWTILLVP